jgi:hypothetical protein
MPNKYLERRSVRSELSTYLTNLGWTDLNFEEGFLHDEAIKVPCVAVHFLPSNFKALQMGRGDNNYITRIVQLDCYMESEPRADAISEVIADFLEMTPIPIKDQNNVELGILNSDSETITWQTVAPNMTNAKIIRWRSIIRVTYHAYYY